MTAIHNERQDLALRKVSVVPFVSLFYWVVLFLDIVKMMRRDAQTAIRGGNSRLKTWELAGGITYIGSLLRILQVDKFDCFTQVKQKYASHESNQEVTFRVKPESVEYEEPSNIGLRTTNQVVLDASQDVSISNNSNLRV